MQQTRSIHPIPMATLATFVSCLVLFLAHRALTWSYLDDATTMHGLAVVKALTVGALSDVWVAGVCACIVFAISMVIHIAGKSGARWVAAVCVLMLGGLAALHQSYVAFFHFQIAPFHLTYLTDTSFLRANRGAVVETRVLITLAMGLMLSIGTFFFSRRKSSAAFWSWTGVAALIVLSLAAHNRNIKYRVQWFVPENLQAHPLERLYLSWKTMRPVEPLSAAQINLLAEAVRNPVPALPMTRSSLIQLISKPAGEPTPGFETALRDTFKAHRDANNKPLIAIVLMESMRPSETGYFAPNEGSSFTPQLDKLAAQGVAFTRAFSTGSVTRAGQEAVLCGYRSSRDLALMRHPAAPTYPCLTQALAGSAETLWLHGGDGRFDGQVAFWQRFGVKQIMDSDAFPKDTARTGWGVGDVTFLKEAGTRLQTAQQTTTSPQLLALMLTESHHIPWDMPSDAPPHLSGIVASHPSYRTAAYADAALGLFVEQLVTLGLWDNTLLIVTSDHGNRVPPAASLYPGGVGQPLMQSHVNLVLSGGITAAALSSTAVKPFMVDTVTTHTDIAVLVARLMALPDFRSMSEGLFATERRLPVLAMLEDDLFEPETGEQWRRPQLVQDLPETLDLPLYIERALRQLAATPNP